MKRCPKGFIAKFLLIMSLLIAAPIAGMVVGAIYFGWLGALAGLGGGIIFFKIFGVWARHRFSRALERQVKKLEQISDVLASAVTRHVRVEEAPRGEFLEGDEEVAKFYPRHFYLYASIDPMHEGNWDPSGLFVEALVDEDLVDDDSDAVTFGEEVYFFGSAIESGSLYESTSEEERRGPCSVRLHFAAGKDVEKIVVKYHLSAIDQFVLPSAE